MLVQHLPAATRLRSPIWIVPGGAEPANMLAPPASRAEIRRGLRPVGPISSSRRGTAVWGNLAGLAVRPAQRRRWQQHVRQPADPGLGIVEQDGDAAAETRW